MWWKRDNKDPKGDKVPLVEKCIKEMIQFVLLYPPFCFSMLESKNAMLITGRKNIEDHYLRKLHHIFQTLIHDFHTGFLGF